MKNSTLRQIHKADYCTMFSFAHLKMWGKESKFLHL